MKRRTLLFTLLAVPMAGGLLSLCRHDDSDAILAAITAGKPIKAGTYFIRKPITLPKGSVITGSHFTFEGDGGFDLTEGCVFADNCIKMGKNKTPGTYCITFSQNSHMRDVRFGVGGA